MTILLILLALGLSVWIWFATKPMTREEAIHKAQQDALRRHRASREADRLRAESYWKGRASVIKPIRFCAAIDENETPT